MNMRGMGCVLYIRCALSIHQKECRKSLGYVGNIGARYLPENTTCLGLARHFPGTTADTTRNLNISVKTVNPYDRILVQIKN
jgi:hypothetical protein